MYLKEKQSHVLVVSRGREEGEKILTVLINIYVVEHGLQVSCDYLSCKLRGTG